MPQSYYAAGFAGPYIRIPFGQVEVNYTDAAEHYDASITPGIAVGVEAGMHLGPGIIVLDVRYAQDIFYVESNSAKQYRAGSVEFSIGYKIGFLLTDY